MKTFKAIVGMLAVLVVASQTFRHVYVQWVEPRGSILNQFDTTKQNIAEAKTLEELLAMYRPALEKKRAVDKKSNGEDEYRRYMEEPYKSELQIREAIQEWETHRQELTELHFYWWAGLVSVLIGAVIYLRGKQWLGMSLFVLGYLEMIWATSPAFQTFGYPLEFERLLTFKIVYSTIALFLLFVGWRIEHVQSKTTTEVQSIAG